MRKRILSVLAICAIIACLFSACSIDNSQPGDDRGVGYVTFGNQLTSSARSLTPSYDVAAYEDLYWFYDAKKVDSYGMTGQGNGQKIPGTDGKGLAGEVGPFSQGTWNFTLYAYSSASKETLVYKGETGDVVITAGAVTNIPVSVEPQGGTGIIQFGKNAYFTWAVAGGGIGKPIVKFTLTRTDATADPIVITVTPNNKNDDGVLMLEGTLSDSVPVGYYNCHISAYLNEEYESTPLAEQEISFRVYGNAAVIIDGDITEGVDSYVSFYASFDADDTGLEVFSGNATEVTVNDVTVDFSSAGLDEASTHYLTLESVSGAAAESLYQDASSVPVDESNRVAVTSLDLTLSQVTSDNNQSAVTTFSEPVTVTTTVASGLENVTVVYDGKGEQPQDVSYTASTGELSFKTSHFSRFYVLADSRILNVEKGAYYASLADAIADVDGGETIKLIDNIVLHNQIVFSNRKFTLDLAGHSIKPSNDLVLTSGVIYLKNDVNMTIEDSVGTGSIDMRTERLDANNQYAAIYAAVALMPEGGYSSSLTVNGGTLAAQYYAIAGNGSSGLGETAITINGGTLISADGASIYHPQRGVLTVNDGTFVATDSAIELRSGTLVINGGTFTATESPIDTAPNGSGTTTKGAAIAIAQHTTKFPINVVINGGTFNGYHAFYEHTPQDEPNLDVISIQINGGTFNAPNDSKMPVHSEDFSGFINAGTFSDQIDSKYVAVTSELAESGEAWVVTPIFEGSGSESEPYQIGSVDQLKKLAELVNAGTSFQDEYFILTCNLDLENENWTPIGTAESLEDDPYAQKEGYFNGFAGTFDGQGHTISNLLINQETNLASWAGAYLGLFGVVYPGATLKDFTINNVDITGNSFLGAAVGYCPNDADFPVGTVKLSGIDVKGKVNIEGESNMGALLGRVETQIESVISDCHIVADEGSEISSSPTGLYTNFAGGLAGSLYSTTSNVIEDVSVANLTVTGDVEGVGALCGHINHGTVSDVKINNVTAQIVSGRSTGNDRKSIGAIAGLIGGSASDSGVALLKISGTNSFENVVIQFPIAEFTPNCHGLVGTYRIDSIDSIDPSSSVTGATSYEGISFTLAE